MAATLSKTLENIEYALRSVRVGWSTSVFLNMEKHLD